MNNVFTGVILELFLKITKPMTMPAHELFAQPVIWLNNLNFEKWPDVMRYLGHLSTFYYSSVTIKKRQCLLVQIV